MLFVLPVVAACALAPANLTVLFRGRLMTMPGQVFSIPTMTKLRALDIRGVFAHRSFETFLYTRSLHLSPISVGHSRFDSFLATPIAVDGQEYPAVLTGPFGNTWAQEWIRNSRSLGSTLHVYDSWFNGCQTQTETQTGQASFGLSGGALYCVPTNVEASVLVNVTIETSNFTACTSQIQGGAIYASRLNSLSISECRFENCVNTKDGGSALLLRGITGCTVRASQFINNEDKAEWPGTVVGYDLSNAYFGYLLMDGSRFTYSEGTPNSPADFTYQTTETFDQGVMTFECVNFVNPTLAGNRYLNLNGKMRFFLWDLSFDKRSYEEAVSVDTNRLALETRNIFEYTYAIECLLPPTEAVTTDEPTIIPVTPQTSPPTASPVPTSTPMPTMTPAPTATDDPGIGIGVIIAIIVVILILLIIIIIILLLLLCKKRRYAFIPPKADPLDEGAYEIPLNFSDDGAP